MSKRKKIICIASAGALCILLVVALFFILKSCNNKSGAGQDSDSSSSDDTAALPAVTDEPYIYDDGNVDPENAELNTESGKNITADEIQPESGRTNGVDVSKWQGKIDWQAVKNSGMDFAFIRIGYRGGDGKIYKDDNADYNIQKASDAGLLVGVYFFSTAVNKDEAREEAEWTVNAIKGYAISYPVVYDCEGFRNPSSRMHSVSAIERTENAASFLAAVEKAGYEPMLYGSKSELENSAYWNISELDTKYMVWVAQYPAVTYPEKSNPDYGNKFSAWQYTNMGAVPGIDGSCDLSVCYFERSYTAPKDSSVSLPQPSVPQSAEDRKYTAVSDTVTAKDETNLRSAATTKSDIVAVLKNGQTVTRTGIGSNGWSRLDYNGQTVYAITSYLTTDLTQRPQVDTNPNPNIVAGNTFTECSDSVTAKEFVNLRTLPTTESDIAGTLSAGQFLERTGTSDKGWSRLVYNGQSVYAITSYLTTEYSTDEPSTETGGATEYNDFEPTNDNVTAKIETNLRTAPSTVDSQVVYTLKNGEFVHRIGISVKGWSKLEYNGQIVYAVSSYLTTDTAQSTDTAPENGETTSGT